MPALIAPIEVEEFEANHVAVQAITLDQPGHPLAFGPLVNLPGPQSLQIGGNVKTDELRGGGGSIDQRAKITMLKVTIVHALLSLDALAVMAGGTESITGATPNTQAKYSQTVDKLPAFLLEASSDVGVTDQGDVHHLFWKCRLDAVPKSGFGNETFEVPSLSFSVMRPFADRTKLWDILVNETALPIVAHV
ncbi:MAG: hypothetical protein ABR598_07710 [Candidatus Dormibacteria bacterium]